MTNKLQKILAGVCLAGAVGMSGGCGEATINGKPISECDPIGWTIDLSADLHEIATRPRESEQKSKTDAVKTAESEYKSNTSNESYKN